MKKKRYSFKVRLKKAERVMVEAQVAQGVSESDAIRNVLVDCAQIKKDILNPPDLPDFPKYGGVIRASNPFPGLKEIEMAMDRKKHSLEDCAHAIVDMLDPNWRDWLLEVSQQVLKVPLWQVIAGNLILACDRGEVQSATLDPKWGEPSKDTPLTDKECPACHKSFMPTRLGQVVCSNPCSAVYEKMKNPAPVMVPNREEGDFPNLDEELV